MKSNKYLTSTEIKEELLKKNINVSKNTIINVSHEINFEYKKPTDKPLLTEKQIVKRIEWCNKYLNFNWGNVKFTDEASIWIGFTGKRWVDSENDDFNLCVKHPFKVHIWGSISINFEREIYVFTGILTGIKYIDILRNNLKIEHNLIFQDDNDPKHRSKIVKLWKDENKIVSLDWPSNSPDLNPIENIWALLKNKIKKRPNRTTKEFTESIIECWKEIDQEHINNAINSVPNRINKGKSINY
jgi:transposase